MTQTIFAFITSLLSTGGYPTLLILTLLDSTVLPVPNEAIMPFTGFLISQGRFSFAAVVMLSAVGGVLGSLTSYAIGWYGAAPFVARFGRYARVTRADLEKTHAMFARYGDRIILVSRFIPLIRQFVSIPAGAARMPMTKFCLYTAIGSTLWNSAILFAGYQFGEHWESVNRYSGAADKGAFTLFAIAALWYARRHWRKRRSALKKTENI